MPTRACLEVEFSEVDMIVLDSFLDGPLHRLTDGLHSYFNLRFEVDFRRDRSLFCACNN